MLAIIVLASWPTVEAAPVERTSTCVPVRTGDPLPPLASAVDVRERAPIAIRGDAMFRLGLAAGVCGGSGTAQDPYRIEQWYIDADNWTVDGGRAFEAALEISGTTAHVLVRNVTIVHAGWPGILVRAAQNVRIENVLVDDGSLRGFLPSFAVSVVDSRNVVVSASRFVQDRTGARDFTGVSVERSADVTVAGNVFEQAKPLPTRYFGVHAGNSTGTRIVDNVLLAHPGAMGRWHGLHLNDEVSPVVERNVLAGGSLARGACVTVLRVHTPRLADNTLGHCGDGLHLQAVTGGEVRGNRVHNATRGVLVEGSTGLALRGNRMVDLVRSFNVTGSGVADFHHDVAGDNTVDGQPVLYLRNVRGRSVDASGAALVFVVGSRDVAVTRAAPVGESVGLTVVDTVRATFTDLDLRGNDLGFRVLASHDVRFDRVQTSGVRVEGSDDVVLANLTVRTAGVGVAFVATDTSRLERSLVEGNVLGIRVEGGNTVTIASTLVRGNTLGGIHLRQPDFVRVTESDVTGNGLFGVRHDGVTLGGSRSDLTGTWWGHTGGPTTGTTVAGDRLLVGNGAVVAHSPWLAAPAAGAGPATP